MARSAGENFGQEFYTLGGRYIMLVCTFKKILKRTITHWGQVISGTDLTKYRYSSTGLQRLYVLKLNIALDIP